MEYNGDGMDYTQGKYSLGLFLLGLTLALGMIFAAYFISSAMQKIKLQNGTITVKGYAEKKIISDFVKWSCELNILPQNTLKEAYVSFEEDRQKIWDYLASEGIEKDTLSMSSIYANTVYKKNDEGNFTNEVEGYSLSQDFYLSSYDLSKISQVSIDITQLLQEGVHIFSRPPEYFYLKLDEMKVAMLGEAAKDARTRAEQLASNSGSKVGGLRSAQQGVFQITAAYSTSCSDYGECDTSSINKSIKAIVTMEYGIE